MQDDPRRVEHARRTFLRRGSGVLGGLLAMGVGERVCAASPLRIAHVLCGAASGSTPDILARRVAEELAGHYAQRVVVDNRPGAAGRIAIGALKLAANDGSTMLLASGTVVTVNPHLLAPLGYDPVADLQPVSLVAEMPLALAIGRAVPESVGSVRELIDWMRRNPKLANAGSPGAGTLPHLLEAMLFKHEDVSWEHVAYPGGAPAVNSLLGGQIAVVMLPEGILRPHRQAGGLRIVATSGARRSTYLPDVPTFVEQGYGDLVVQEWFAMFMPAGASADTIDAASRAIQAAVARPAVSGAFAESGIVAISSTPNVVGARIAAERIRWEAIIRATGVRSD